jgi:hypothetical protein
LRKLKLPVTFVAFALLATPALAAPADGCGAGDEPVILQSFDNTGITVAFSGMFTEPGDGVTCSFETGTIVVPDTPSDAIYAYSSDYRALGEDGDTISLQVDENGNSASVTVPAPTDFSDAVILHSYLGVGYGGTIATDVAFQLDSPDPASNAELLGVDYGLLGYTTISDQERSLEQVSSAQTAVVTHLNTTAGLIVGTNQPLDRPDQVGLIGAVGSHTVGVTGHLNLGDGFSLDGGAAIFEQSTGGASIGGVLLGGKASYLEPESGSGFRLLGNAGVTAAPGMSMSFSRSYTLFGAGDDFAPLPVTENATGNGTMIGAFLEGGVLVAPDPNNEIVFSASYARNWLTFDGVSEEQSDTNPFAASFDDALAYDTIKAKAAWTTSITDDVKLTAHGAIGYLFAPDEVVTNVALIGPLTVSGQDEIFAEYGARLGWDVTETTQVGAFVVGSSGSESGTHVQVGADVSMKF